ncbi:MAG: hypothetical protein JWO31_1492 [Phycisphaerales bacterium]|nr:hypothetical protein [Phycisphaerales bacterium]
MIRPIRLPGISARPLPLVVVACVLWAPTFATHARGQAFEKDAKPFLAAYCADCHKPGKAKGDLDLSKFQAEPKGPGAGKVWESVTERVRAGEMPPAKSKQPGIGERDRMLASLKPLMKEELDCGKVASDATMKFYPGHVMSRRLNRTEYANTVRDLLGGLDTGAGDDLPTDGAGGEGFDNNGDALFTSAIHVEQYVDAAGRALAPVFGGAADDAGGKPLPPERVAAARKAVVVAAPDDRTLPREAARLVVAEFARRAFRRPPEPPEVERYLTLFDKASARGDGYEPALKLALQAVLVSPNFLFLVEPEPEQDGVYELGDFPLASRLSYFLWATMPDEELYQLAAAGKLRTDDALRSQVRRMLKDPKARGMADSFAVQWLGLRPLGTTAKPDPTLYPEFTDAIAAAMREEAVRLFDYVVREDRPLTDLLDADYTFVNDDLAHFYGLPPVAGKDLQKVALPDRTRGGILGLGAVHVTTSYARRTSPVLRGKWVLGDVLGTRVPPPPPNVPELPADGKSAEGLSLRAQLELHRKNPDCAGCHSRMDPLGFGLENFDAIGRWRDTLDGKPLDTSGVLPGGDKFGGPAELKKVLLKRKAEFQTNLTRKLLGFSLGRELMAGGRRPGQFDQCVIDDCAAALAKADGRAGAVFETIALSRPFRYRFVRK